MKNEERISEIMDYWFGNSFRADLPSPKRTQLWFGENEESALLTSALFQKEIDNAALGKYDEWQQTAHSTLALIFLLSIFPHKIYKTGKAYAQDMKALNICLQAIKKNFDHQLSLMERVFFYMPLKFSESIDVQRMSLKAYESLYHMSLSETKELFQTFLNLAADQFSVIKEFGRFPERNEILNRKSTEKELEYLNE